MLNLNVNDNVANVWRESGPPGRPPTNAWATPPNITRRGATNPNPNNAPSAAPPPAEPPVKLPTAQQNGGGPNHAPRVQRANDLGLNFAENLAESVLGDHTRRAKLAEIEKSINRLTLVVSTLLQLHPCIDNLAERVLHRYRVNSR